VDSSFVAIKNEGLGKENKVKGLLWLNIVVCGVL
jgi:hypothetical protein